MADDQAKMRPQGGWVTVAVAALGIIGTLGSGFIGYQSGALSVNKDYVQIAMRNLAEEKSSPELRRWSVDILNKLAPVPFDEELKDQLVINRFIAPDVPESLRYPCPDILTEERAKERREPDAKIAATFVVAYEECRMRYDALLEWYGVYRRELKAEGMGSLPPATAP